jgi:hypothetical protein
MSVGVYTMLGLWRGSGDEQRPAVSAEFEHALTQEVLRTELVRVKALVATTLLLTAIVWTVYFLAPDAVSAVWGAVSGPATSMRRWSRLFCSSCGCTRPSVGN